MNCADRKIKEQGGFPCSARIPRRGRKEIIMITAEMVAQYKKEHENEAARVRGQLKSPDNVTRAYAKSVIYGCHDPLLYAIRDKEIFGQEYEGIEYVFSVFEKYGYETREYYEDGIHCIDALKEGQIRAKLTFSDLYKRVSMFSVK